MGILKWSVGHWVELYQYTPGFEVPVAVAHCIVQKGTITEEMELYVTVGFFMALLCIY